jgi:hypothetical protein
MKQEIEKLIKENQIEVAITLGAVRLENIEIDGFGDIGAIGIFDVGGGDEVECGLAFKFPKDVNSGFVDENNKKSKRIIVAGKELMYIKYNI